MFEVQLKYSGLSAAGRWWSESKACGEREITSNVFILFSKARENKGTAKDWEGVQVDASHLQQASRETGSILIQPNMLWFLSVG